MPTRPTRRERRRAERRNAKKGVPPLPKSAPPSVAEFGPLSPSVFLNAEPIIRTVMRVVLIQTSFTISQVHGFDMWKEVLEQVKLRSSALSQDQHEYQLSYFDAILDLHDAHVRELKALQLRYAEQVVMWGFECSKAEEEWDMNFIARRQLELAQLNRLTNKMAITFEAKLQGVLENRHAFSSEKEMEVLLRTLERFRENFADGVEIADKETAAALEEMGCEAMMGAIGRV